MKPGSGDKDPWVSVACGQLNAPRVLHEVVKNLQRKVCRDVWWQEVAEIILNRQKVAIKLDQ